MQNPPPCINWAEKLVLRYEDLSPADQAGLDAHIKTCPRCQAAQADYHFLDARLRALPPPAIKPFPRISFPTSAQVAERDTRRRAAPFQWFASARQRGKHISPVVSILKKGLAGVLVASLVLSLLVFFSGRSALNTAIVHPLGSPIFTYTRQSGFIAAVAWSPDGRYLASASWDHTVQVWDVKTGALLLSYQQNDIVDALAWSPDGRYLASGSWDHTVQVWDVQDQILYRVYTLHTDIVSTLAWSPDGRYLASGSWDQTARVWDFRTGSTLFTYQYNEIVDAVAWSPDGRSLAIGGRDDFVHILSTTTWTEQFVFKGSSYLCGDCVVNAVAWSPDSRYIASGDRSGIVEVWDMQTDNLTTTYKGHAADVFALAWSPDGHYIASAGADFTVQVWQALTGLPLIIYRGHSQNVDALAWSPDSRYIASGSWDNTVQVWQAAYGR